MAALRPQLRGRAQVTFVIWCTQHLNHAVQATLLTNIKHGYKLLSTLYSASLLLRSGTTWLTFLATLDVVLAERLVIRRGPPPPEAAEHSQLLISFVRDGACGLGKKDVHLHEAFTILHRWLNAPLWETELVHYCGGPECCPGGRETTLLDVKLAILRSVLRKRPTVPELSKWTKPVSSIDFWLCGTALGMLFVRILCTMSRQPEHAAAHADLRELIRDFDPAYLYDSEAGFRALRGSRLKKAVTTLSSKDTLPMLLLAEAFLDVQRYINKYLNSSIRSTRVRAAVSGHSRRPPALDLTNEAWSPVVVALQALSSLLVWAPGRQHVFYDLLRAISIQVEASGEFSVKELHPQLRIGSATTSGALHWRHSMRFRQMQFVLAQTVDPLQPTDTRNAAQTRYFQSHNCCVGETVEELRAHLTARDVAGPGRWSDFWA